ncbi:hypothetical protein PT286_04705 [Neisseriaceae bacterium ESL0693]|nr:hypothetical protein [Neisseriaceae bacterium ESL0693]
MLCGQGLKPIIWTMILLGLMSCATPEQKAAQAKAAEEARERLVVQLAAQCDAHTAELMQQQMQNPAFLSDPFYAKEAEEYQKSVSAPLFQSCYKLAWENYLNEVRLQEMRTQEMNRRWHDEFDWMRQPRWCRGYHQGKPFVYRCG